jgi:hypothetical protein
MFTFLNFVRQNSHIGLDRKMSSLGVFLLVADTGDPLLTLYFTLLYFTLLFFPSIGFSGHFVRIYKRWVLYSLHVYTVTHKRLSQQGPRIVG